MSRARAMAPPAWDQIPGGVEPARPTPGPLGVMPSRQNAPVSRCIAECGRDTPRIWQGPGVSGHESGSGRETELNLRAAGSMLSPLHRGRRGEVSMGFATPWLRHAIGPRSLPSYTQLLRTLRMFGAEISANCGISSFRRGGC